MDLNRKEEIILAILELAAEKGLGNVSTNMIADRVGIKKPSLYNHFASKEEIVQAMYQFLRKKAKENANISMVDYGALIKGKTALEVLRFVVHNYADMSHDQNMWKFYKVIYSERSMEPMAAKIMYEETNRMILATKQLFYALQIHGLLCFKNPDLSALSFAMTIHGLMEYEADLELGQGELEDNERKNQLEVYLKWFCEENSPS